jgi:hypothetical protein
MHHIAIVLALLVVAATSYGQADTLIEIRFPSMATKVRVVQPGAGIFQKTAAGHGLINVHPLAPEASILNLMDNTRFTVPTVVNDAIIGYPASASIQLMIYKENTASAQCSGSMVAPNLVLTAAHCLIDQDTRTVRGDEIVVAAAGKNLVNGGTLVSKVKSAYVLKDYLDNNSKEDIMLLELDETIGDHTGWMGMAANIDTAFINKTVFHKFSFPARNYEPENAPGRRLHYNYGLVDVLGPELLGINSGSAVATGGQSGSALFYMEEANPYIVGVSIYSRLYQHQRITKKIMSLFAPIVDRSIAQANAIPYTFYPNPMRQTAVVRMAERLGSYTLVITDSSGQISKTQRGTDSQVVFIEKSSLPAGEYTFMIMDEKGKATRGSFRVID